MDEPDLAIGSWVCPCGLTKCGKARGSVPAEFTVECQYCGARAHIMALLYEATS